MQSKAATPDAYIAELPEDRKAAVKKLRAVIKKNLPKGFKEQMNYGMLGYVVPLSLYPDGYHCTADTPLPFMNVASQKNGISVYHMGMYADKGLLTWFTAEFKKRSTKKLDMGKSCVRFASPNDIPYDLVGELAAKMTPQQWIAMYEKNYKK